MVRELSLLERASGDRQVDLILSQDFKHTLVHLSGQQQAFDKIDYTLKHPFKILGRRYKYSKSSAIVSGYNY